MAAKSTYSIGESLVQVFEKSFSINGVNIYPEDPKWQGKLYIALSDIASGAKNQARSEIRAALGIK